MHRPDHDWELAEANLGDPVVTPICEGTHQDTAAFTSALNRYVRVADDGSKRVGWVYERQADAEAEIQ